MSDLTGPGIELKTSRADSDVLNHSANRLIKTVPKLYKLETRKQMAQYVQVFTNFVTGLQTNGSQSKLLNRKLWQRLKLSEIYGKTEIK